ncbi:DUF4118 domain-containing protein [Alloalcanivorax xenomutans]|uniref:DUF4118 domain-containing protein n=1 Tax=Alloalcanivorax xenomutans TaxID=1094342 RepID=UPI003BA9EA2D
MKDPTTPDPDALLAVNDDASRGRLKIFIGAAPGVGKTYAMLQAARELARQGQPVLLGVIESHGRGDTEALCADLPRLPLRPIQYRGRRFHEFDLQGALQQHPSLILVDELAHRNIPGSLHPRRYQDIEDLLAAGIDVWTTVNVQHLESLNDHIARITGVRMRETVPDALVQSARDLILVDLPPDQLLERLRQGKVYVPEQARAAMDHFFNRGNLTALRELALQTVANRIDHDVFTTMASQGVDGPWPVRPRLLVLVDGRGNDKAVVRAAARMAQRRRAPWSTLWVDTGQSPPDTQKQNLEAVFRLTEQLGGDTVTLHGHDVVAMALDHARHHNVTSIVFGRSRHRPLAGLFGRTLSQKLMRRGRDFELTCIASAPPRHRRRWRAPGWPPARQLWLALSVVAVSVLAAAVADHFLALPNLSLIFLTGVLLVASRTGMRAATFAAVLSLLTYNFFFTEPFFSLAMYHTQDILTVAFFLVIAMVTGQLASRLRNQVVNLRRVGDHNRSLLRLSRKLGGATGIQDVQREAGQYLSREFATVVKVVPAQDLDDDKELTGSLRTAAQWALESGKQAGHGTDTLGDLPQRIFPLRFRDQSLGVLLLGTDKLKGLDTAVLSHMETLANQVALALWRVQLSATLEASRVAEETERLRSALLSSISHDLRTPLSSMIGAASSLRDQAALLSDEHRRELLDAILNEGHRLNSYIQNLLDMTRLGHGTLKLARDWIAPADLIAAALKRTAPLTANLTLHRQVEADLPLLFVHPALIEQVLVNLIENAAKFSPPGGEITLAARAEADRIVVEVSDQGPGIPEDQREKVFDMFFTGGDGDRGPYGSGLGLAICRGMIGAHGGTIEALPPANGSGAHIVITLPLMEQQPDGPNHV